MKNLAFVGILSLLFAGWLSAQEQTLPEENGFGGTHLGPSAPNPPAPTLDWETQDRLAAQHQGWQQFLVLHPDWTAIFEEHTGQLWWAYGPGFQVAPENATDAELAEVGNTMRNQLIPFLNGDPSDYEFKSVLRAGHLAYVHFIQRAMGLRVWNARLSLRIDTRGRLVAFGGRFLDTRAELAAPILNESTALDRAVAYLKEQGFANSSTLFAAGTVEPVVHVRETRLGYELTPAWYWFFGAENPEASWCVFVGFDSGTVIDCWNDTREHCDPTALLGALNLAMINGAVQGTVHDGVLPDQPAVMRDFPDITLLMSGVSVVTDALGLYSYNGGPATVTVTSGLDGPWLNGQSLQGISASFSGSASTGLFNIGFTDTNSSLAERDAIYFANKSHTVLKQRAPTITQLDNIMQVRPNSTATCNATYSPATHTITFYNAGGGCVNTAYMPSVVEHEYGHGVTNRVYTAAGQAINGYMGEGLSDCQGGACEDTAVTGAGFFGVGTVVRNMNNTCQYPSSCGTAIHARGQVIGGCYWHTRVQFFNAYGAAGKVQMDEYLYRHLVGAPANEIESVLEMLLLDDNDANLTNGTPNLLRFHTGFTTQHSVPFPVPLIGFTHDKHSDSQDQLQPYQIRTQVTSFTGTTVNSLVLSWRVGTGAFTNVAMTNLGSGNWVGSIPVAPLSSTVEYYMTATAGTVIARNPTAAPGQTHSFRTSRAVSIYADNFDSATTLWTSALVATQNDWQRGTPGNTAHLYDPPSAYQGTGCFGNDLTIGNFNGTYQNNVNNHLTSPAINCTGSTGVQINYRRWLTVEDANFDQARILVSNNNGATFTQVWQNNAGTGNHIDTSWASHTVPIGTIADNQQNVRVRYQLQTNATNVFGGWSLDDFRLESLSTAPILTTSGSTQVGQTFTLNVDGDANDTLALALSPTLQPSFFAPIGTLSLDVLSPTTIFLALGQSLGVSGDTSFSFTVPPSPGVTLHFQAVLVRAPTLSTFLISNVVSVTL